MKYAFINHSPHRSLLHTFTLITPQTTSFADFDFEDIDLVIAVSSTTRKQIQRVKIAALEPRLTDDIKVNKAKRISEHLIHGLSRN